MKKRNWIISSIISAVLAIGVFIGVTHAAMVTFTFTYDFSATSGDPACTTLLTSNCVKQFKLYHLDNSNNVVQDQIIPLPTPTPVGLTTFNVNQKVGPPYGNITYGVVAQAVGNDGVTIVESAPLTVQVTGKPGPPKSFTTP